MNAKNQQREPLKLGIWLLAGLMAMPAAGESPEELLAGTGDRIDQMFHAESGQPYSLENVRNPLSSNQPYWSRYYSWSIVGYAARCFYLNESLTEANARLQQNAKFYLRELTPTEEAAILIANPQSEGNTSQYSRIYARDSFHWHADIVLRLIEMYGTNGTVAPGRMDATTEAKCLESIWHYARIVPRINMAEYENSETWDIWQSENHHAQIFALAWHFSKIAKDRPEYQNLRYNDNSTPAQQYAAWNAYFIEYVRERFQKGIFVEMRSDAYNGESIRGVYNMYDFGNAEVKERARMYLDLFWAYWAQEQFNDVSGGGKARINMRNSFETEHTEIVGNMAWMYFGLGVEPPVNGQSINPILSSYRPPSVVADIAVDVDGRGTYEVRQAAQGLGSGATTDWDQSKTFTPYGLNTDGGGILRYTYCDPAFIMGTPMVQARPLNDWTAISSQGRWQGVIFSGAEDTARIVPCVQASDNQYVRNAYWTVQAKGSMITQMLNTQTGGAQMWAWISKAGIGDPVEENGIIFVETDEVDGAYAAIRPVGTGFTIIEDYNFPFPHAGHWIVQLNDKFKPMIMEVMRKDEVADFAAFKALVQSNTPSVVNNLVTYTTIYGDVLTLDASYNNDPTINGVAVDYSPDKVYDSPFLQGDYNGETFVIQKGARQEVYEFIVPPAIETFSPADEGTGVATTSNLAATFNKPMQAGTGSISIRRLSDHGLVESIPADDTNRVSITDNQVTINPFTVFQGGTSYYVTIDENAFEDLNGLAFGGISGSGGWNFTTLSDRPILVVNTGSKVVASSLNNSSTTYSFNAFARAEMLIVAISTERSTETRYTVSYAGHPMTKAVEVTHAGIYYLDLRNTTYSGGSANLVVNFAGVNTVNGVGIGAVSVETTGDYDIVLNGTGSGTNSASLSTTADGSFHVVSFNANDGSNPSVDPPLTTLYANSNIGSAQGAAGYSLDNLSGSQTYTWTATNKRKVAAASFVVANSYANWTREFGITGNPELDDDPDGDGKKNAVEAWFGTDPDAASPGVGNITTNGTVSSFTHPQSANPPDDLAISYQWSTNLLDWYACDGSDGPEGGVTVIANATTDRTTTTVTFISSGMMPYMFLRTIVSQAP